MVRLILAVSMLTLSIAPSHAQQQPQRQQQRQPAQPPAPAAPAPQAADTPAAPSLPTELPPTGAPMVILDGRLVMTQSLAAQGLRQQAERQNTTLRADVQRQETEFKTAQTELQRQRATITAEQFDQRVRDLQKRMSDAQTKLQNRTRNLDRAFAEAEGKIYQAMLQASVEVAQEKNYMLILDKAQVVVVQSQLEITGEILKRVDQRLASVPLQIPAN